MMLRYTAKALMPALNAHPAALPDAAAGSAGDQP